jgi:hypothetical protein
MLEPLRRCQEREMPPSPFLYVAYDEHGREIGRHSEPVVTASVVRELAPARKLEAIR